MLWFYCTHLFSIQNVIGMDACRVVFLLKNPPINTNLEIIKNPCCIQSCAINRACMFVAVDINCASTAADNFFVGPLHKQIMLGKISTWHLSVKHLDS